MAHIEKRGPNRWRARYRTPTGASRNKTFSRRIDAERFLTQLESEKLRGTWVDPSAGRRPFGQYAREWQSAQVHRPTSAARLESNLRNHVLPFFEDRPLASVRPSEVQTWVKGRTEVLAPSSVETVYRYVAAIFRSAVEDQLIGSSPCRGVKLPKAERRRVDPLETEQVLALADAVPDRCRALVLLAAGTGLRQGEAFGVTVPACDFLRRSLAVEQQLVLLPHRDPYLAPPKTDASYRTVPLPDVVLEALARHLEAYEPGPWELVFTNGLGRPISRTRFSDTWRPAVKAAGAPEGTTFHDLRHYYASLLIRHGESVKVVQARLGHASASETLDTYSHLWPDSEGRTRQAVDAVLGAPASSPRPAEAR